MLGVCMLSTEQKLQEQVSFDVIARIDASKIRARVVGLIQVSNFDL